jgi:regulator of protease activity HflC (stomatin/prohibitin superfamily)
MTPLLLFIALLLLALAAVARARLRKVLVFEFERGLLYESGRFHSLLEPGAYWTWSTSRSITKIDIRPRISSVPGQEVLTADGIAVKLSLVARYQVADPVLAINGQQNYDFALHTELQLAIRRVVSALTIDALLAGRASLAEQLTAEVSPAATALGLTLLRADLKDLTLPGDLKKLFSQVTKARQEGLAAMERARGETAALRSLANAARLMEDNPALMQLRLLQVVGEQSGNTVVLGMPQNGSPIPVARGAKGSGEKPKPQDAE